MIYTSVVNPRAPLTRVVPIAAGEVTAVLARSAATPSVVHNHCILDGTLVIQPRQELGGLPVSVGSLPIPVRPQNVGLVGVDEFVHLR